ncbi:hypothetical protein EWE75_22625 [Sphingomonas populi]|uniref:ChaN family lipoprotein n=1 Tax=Sphingomonas populi TaxID=2484750 RepID=A0A4Q6XKA5_9SPHN|nr:DUF5682 family protein [Sphingomonas populi]RZF60530.1 hypothetical protein EWE75_22625 [Sphingomonas populi]
MAGLLSGGARAAPDLSFAPNSYMPEDAAILLSDLECDVHIAPIRHHSPACAWHLKAMIAEIGPAAILIEGPDDYDPLIPLLTHAETRPPVAIVSILEGPVRGASYFPFCAHSPEYVALQEGAARGVPVRFIDLSATDKAMREDDSNPLDPAQPLALDEWAFDSSDYVRALADRLGCRDGNEVWDQLFEARIGEADWRRFFGDVGRYCSHMRESTATKTMEADGTLVREARMVAHLAQARREIKGPILAVVGGFHAPGLVDALPKLGNVAAPPRVKAERPPYLIRYGYRQLNALTGYGAGLPLPAYYEGLWQTVAAGEAAPFEKLAHRLITDFAAHLRTALLGVSTAVPILVATLENAHRLAELRGRPGPLRDDLIDACRSTFLKGEEGGDASPVMAELVAFLTGSAIGDVPASAGSPPLVEAVRQRARALGFRVDDGERRNRELDIYRKPRHRDASRFLHATVFLETGFAQRTGGPDFRSGVDLDRLIEHWSVMWSPLFEARLIERAADGDTIEEALAAELNRRLAALEAQGMGGNASAAIDLFAAACQAGIAAYAERVLPVIEADIVRDADLASVAAALRDLIGLWRGRAALGFDNSAEIESLVGTTWRRALYLLPDLANAGEDRIAATLDALVVLREATGLADESLRALDPVLFDEAIATLLDTELDPALAGAVAALALLAGRIDDTEFATRLSGELRGAYPEMARRIAWLRGVIAISRELLWRVPELIETADQVLSALDDGGFVELLPHLRMAFAALDPREIDRLAHAVAGRHGGDAAALIVRHDLPEAEVAANLRADARVREMLEADGLL